MSDHTLRQLHDKATRGEQLTPEERSRLEEWYTENDEQERSDLSASSEPEEVAELRRMRPWICGVGDPGTGKSHAADPHLHIVEEVCAESEAYAAGVSADCFHIVHSRTYAALEHKLSQTSGYGLVISGEGHALLRPTYPSRGFFDDKGVALR